MNTNAPHIFNQHQPRMNFVGIDLETTGLDLSRDRIVQFAAVCKGLESRAGEEILPDVPVKCEPILARRWSKRAGKVKDKEGKLLAWELDVLRKPS